MSSRRRPRQSCRRRTRRTGCRRRRRKTTRRHRSIRPARWTCSGDKIVRVRCALIMLALTLGLAHADPSPKDMTAARTHVETADREYKLGRFEQALAEYAAAYELYPVPALLFNIGQCHRYLRHFE